MNTLWCIMILTGIIFAFLSGNISNISSEIIGSGNEAISLVLTMAGVVSMWTGFMEIARNAGIIQKLTLKLSPVMTFLFPGVPPKSTAMEYMTTNMIANFIGLGWAATPTALLAMKELSVINKNRIEASNAMCTFLVINISSIQLIPVNIIAYRQSFGSINPGLIIIPAIISTLVSTATAVIFCKIMQKIRKDGL